MRPDFVSLTGLAVLALAAALRGQQSPPSAPPMPVDHELSCRVCHPGAVQGLRQSPHAGLLAADFTATTGQGACASCHGDLSAHATAAGLGSSPLPKIAKVSPSACATCHPDIEQPTSRGRHLLQIVGSGAAPLPAPGRERLQEIAEAAAEPRIDWSGFAELGYRFVHRSGSRGAFRTDLDLPSTALLRDFELRGSGNVEAAFDQLRFYGRDVGDPRWDVGASLHDADRFDVESTYSEANYRYDAAGDYHRVDRDSRDWTTTVGIGPTTLQGFLSYTDRRDDGFWLTRRIGDRSLPVQTFVDGVASPRRFRGHEGELGIRGHAAGLRYLLGIGYVDERTRNRWTYSQPSTANPAFPASEDLRANSRLDGPTARALVARDDGPVQFELSGTYRDLERNLVTSGTAAGFDTAPFTTTTDGTGRGTGRLSTWALEATIELSPTFALQSFTQYRDYEERLALDLTDVRTSTTTVTTSTRISDRTAQRLLDTELRLSWRPTDEFELGVGYGLAREQLRVLAPGPADPMDFRRAELDDDGFVADLRWQFAEHWTLRAEGRDFVTDGVELHELVPERSRFAKAHLDWQNDDQRAGVFVRHRHNDNDVSGHRLDAFATGLTAGAMSESVTWSGSYTFSDTVSRTRTNFYFDPDPNPQPTIVGFDGETHTWTADLTLGPWDDWQAELGGALTRTTGSLQVTTADFRAGVTWRCTESGRLGCEWRRVEYDDRGAGAPGDDWTADLLFVYWRQEW